MVIVFEFKKLFYLFAARLPVCYCIILMNSNCVKSMETTNCKEVFPMRLVRARGSPEPEPRILIVVSSLPAFGCELYIVHGDIQTSFLSKFAK